MEFLHHCVSYNFLFVLVGNHNNYNKSYKRLFSALISKGSHKQRKIDNSCSYRRTGNGSSEELFWIMCSYLSFSLVNWSQNDIFSWTFSWWEYSNTFQLILSQKTFKFLIDSMESSSTKFHIILCLFTNK